jgi:hypothetical protein
MHQDQLKQIDTWAARYGAIIRGAPSRPEAIRKLVAAALSRSPR